ncbi:protein Mis18-alpha-like isoform X1 [Dendrobates tinctorius]|uniref:protein Mis18-alpha-like isoform X1 n=1 Tax=Dendrobates tinctorius TaxID=92724 RepID=UPI003CC9B4F7
MSECASRPATPPADMADAASSAEDHVVFMCACCNLPFGDSGDQQESSDDENLIFLKGVTTNVKINTNKEASEYDLDFYSSVHVLLCNGCSTGIGLLYTATPRHLDYKRGMFILNKNAMTCYSFNNSSKCRLPQEQVNHPTVSYMDKQLKKARMMLGNCTRSLSELEHLVN